MIKINDSPLNQTLLTSVVDVNKKYTVSLMEKYADTFNYPTLNNLLFELEMRQAIVDSAFSLNKSGVKFATFARTFGNMRYWHVTNYGALIQNENVLPSDAIKNIFQSGPMYGFECATAMVIVCYHAILKVLGAKTFNEYFFGLKLYSWEYDNDLRFYTVENNNFLPGDIAYFENPDFNPRLPQWRGENAIFIRDNLLYGHGIGIKSPNEIIATLNKLRKKDAKVDAFLTSTLTRIDYNYLFTLKR